VSDVRIYSHSNPLPPLAHTPVGERHSLHTHHRERFSIIVTSPYLQSPVAISEMQSSVHPLDNQILNAAIKHCFSFAPETPRKINYRNSAQAIVLGRILSLSLGGDGQFFPVLAQLHRYRYLGMVRFSSSIPLLS
jgi:hypothetical protein